MSLFSLTFYARTAAVKCNPNCEVVRVLAKTPGCGFDCASPAEMDQVLGCGVDPSRIIYANPCKDVAALEHALDGEREHEHLFASTPSSCSGRMASALLLRLRPLSG